MENIKAPKAITDNGWLFYEKCRCGGTLKWKFRHPEKHGMQIEWLVRYNQFRISDRSKTIVPLTDTSKLDEILKQL